MELSRALPVVAAALLLAWAGWALYTGRVSVGWGQLARRPSFFYWVVVAALALAGAANLVFALRRRG